jgi:hypothetical protein
MYDGRTLADVKRELEIISRRQFFRSDLSGCDLTVQAT